MKKIRPIIQIDESKCDGCGLCIPSCAEGALKIINGKAKVISDKFCDGLGACLGECPKGALSLIQREAEEFDEKSVEAMLASQGDQPTHEPSVMPCGCPSSHVQILSAPSDSLNRKSSESGSPRKSELSHWPVKIRLIPENASFLKGADLVIAADCVTVAYPDLHDDLLKGSVVMTGCPKFDDVEAYIDKFTRILKTAGVRSITVVSMEVPCCSGMARAVRQAAFNAGMTIPVKEIIITCRGEKADKTADTLTRIA